MRKTTFALLLFFFACSQIFAQTDQSGNPIFNSILTKEKALDDLVLSSNYYTLHNNIENSLSSVFIDENPSLDQIEKAASELPSEFFILTKENRIIVMISLIGESERSFLVNELESGKQNTYPVDLKGKITENRAKEIIRQEYDPEAKLENRILKFNGKEFEIIENQLIEKEVLALIKKKKLDKKKVSDYVIPSQEEIRSFVLSESKTGGELDFFTEIKGSEHDGVQIKPGLFTTKKSVALYQWGRACFDIGVNTLEDAFEIYEEFLGEEPIDRDLDYIEMGFYKDWEK